MLEACYGLKSSEQDKGLLTAALLVRGEGKNMNIIMTSTVNEPGEIVKGLIGSLNM